MGNWGLNNANRARRRGASTVEYALTLSVIVGGLVVVSAIGRSAFVPAMQASTVYGTEAAMPAQNTSALPSVHVDATVNPYAFLAAVVVAIASICFVSGVRHRAIKARQDDDAADDKPNQHRRPRTASERLRDSIFEKRELLLSEMSRDLSVLLHSRVEVGQLMSTHMKIVEPDFSANDVRKLMSTSKLHHLLVCKETKLVGVISDRDLSKSSAKKACDLMTRNPISVSPSTLLIPTVSTMINKRISCLPVTEDGELTGVLTRTDLLLAFQCTLQIMSKLLHDPGDMIDPELLHNEQDSRTNDQQNEEHKNAK